MRLVVFDDDRLGLLRGDEVVDATGALRERGFQSPSIVLSDLIREWEMLAPSLEALLVRERGRPLAQCQLKAPVARPGKVICVPWFQRRPTDRNEASAASAARAYLVAPTALTGPDAVVALPPRPVDYEVGVALVLDCAAGAHAALSPVFGYTGAVALLARGWEERSLRGSRPGFLALGPHLVTHDQLAGPETLALRAWHNESPRLGVGRPPRSDRSARDRTMRGLRRVTKATVEVVLAGLAQWVALEPGDVVVLGGFWPARRLSPGDRVRLVVEPLGQLGFSAAEGAGPEAAAQAAGTRSAGAVSAPGAVAEASANR